MALYINTIETNWVMALWGGNVWSLNSFVFVLHHFYYRGKFPVCHQINKFQAIFCYSVWINAQLWNFNFLPINPVSFKVCQQYTKNYNIKIRSKPQMKRLNMGRNYENGKYSLSVSFLSNYQRARVKNCPLHTIYHNQTNHKKI